MLFNSSLVRRFMLVISSILVVLITVIYFYSVPLIKQKVYEIERNSSRIALNNVFELANKMYFSMEGYREQALAAHKQRLKTVVSLAESYVQDALLDVKEGLLSEEEGRKKIFSRLRNFTFGNNDYIWISDYNSVLLSHPDPNFHGVDASKMQDSEGQFVIPKVVGMAAQEGEGFYQYRWQRLTGDQEIEKISYVKNFPLWGFVIGSGVYLDDIEEEVRLRRKAAVEELSKALAQIKIAKTGYLFIFDSQLNMLVHPNDNINGTNFSSLMNPVTQQSIAKDLIAVADTGQELAYQWDKPSDPGNYSYEKLSLVRFLEGFGWYIGSSVYVDELRSSSEQLSNRLITIGVIAMLIALMMVMIFIEWITHPIKRLAETAVRVSGGELSAKTGIKRADELGVLATTFDHMVDRLRDNINTLDCKVKERTQALEKSNQQLVAAAQEMEKTQLALAAAEQRQRLILDALPAQIAYVSNDKHYLFANKGYAEMFGLTKEGIVGLPVKRVLGEPMLNSIGPYMQYALEGVEQVYEYQFHRNDQLVITKRILKPCMTPQGEVAGLLLLSLDITSEREAERRLLEAQRMNAVGQLAGGLAHDFNNLLSVILGNLLSALDISHQHEPLERCLKPAIRAARRGADITSRLLAFSRRQPLKPTSVNLSELIEQTVALLEGSLPDHMNLSYQVDCDGYSPYVDTGQLEDALVNLALNARDAMPNGGLLEIKVTDRQVDQPVGYDEPVRPGHYIEISVSDQGEGFTEEAISMAFEPFFTTKSGGAGSGLGLSMVYGFVKQSQGYINISSEQGEGSTISLLLPAVACSSEEVEEKREQPNSLFDDEEGNFAGKLLLLVEDNDDVREMVRKQLLKLGFHVVEASSAREAEDLITSIRGLYGMVTDVVLPGDKNGFDLASLAHQKDPKVRLILMSGFSWQQEKKAGLEIPHRMLRKPFEMSELGDAFSQLSKDDQANGFAATPEVKNGQ